jgi:transcription elongation factor Elf1
MESELLPCPFCGANAKIIHNVMFGNNWIIVNCTICSSATSSRPTEELASKLWNTRINKELDIIKEENIHLSKENAEYEAANKVASHMMDKYMKDAQVLAEVKEWLEKAIKESDEYADSYDITEFSVLDRMRNKIKELQGESWY